MSVSAPRIDTLLAIVAGSVSNISLRRNHPCKSGQCSLQILLDEWSELPLASNRRKRGLEQAVLDYEKRSKCLPDWHTVSRGGFQ